MYDQPILETAEVVLEVLAKTRTAQASPILTSMLGFDALKSNFVSHLSDEVDRMTNDELAKGFAHHCPVAGAEPNDYRTRLFDLPGFGRALVGIRFRGLDLARPFVAVAASELLPSEQREFLAAIDVIAGEFEVFAPKHVQLFLPLHARLEPRGPDQFWEKRLLVGRVGELASRPEPRGHERLTLSAPVDDRWYARYQRAFERLVELSPEYTEYTRMETREDLSALLVEGTLFEVAIDEEWAGLVAVARDGVEGVDGYLMIEILLAEHARGQGFGHALQRRLVERLPDRDKPILGAIDARNLPAIRAAKAVGRVDVGGYLWASFA